MENFRINYLPTLKSAGYHVLVCPPEFDNLNERIKPCDCSVLSKGQLYINNFQGIKVEDIHVYITKRCFAAVLHVDDYGPPVAGDEDSAVKQALAE